MKFVHLTVLSVAMSLVSACSGFLVDDYAAAEEVLRSYNFDQSAKHWEIFENYRNYQGLKSIAISPSGAIADTWAHVGDGDQAEVRETVLNSMSSAERELFLADLGEASRYDCNARLLPDEPECQVLMINDRFVWEQK